MPLEAQKYLFDIQQALDLIDAFCAGKSFTDYRQDAMLRFDDRIVWGVVEGKLPKLRAEVKKLLAADTA